MTPEEIEEYKRAPMSGRARDMYEEKKEADAADAEMKRMLLEEGGLFNA